MYLFSSDGKNVVVGRYYGTTGKLDIYLDDQDLWIGTVRLKFM